MEASSLFQLAVADTFALRGRGIVAGGRIEAGVARVGDLVDVLFEGRSTPAVVAGIEMIGRPCFGPPASGRAGILLTGLAAGDIGPGALVRGRADDQLT